jgi:hypothetical protein
VSLDLWLGASVSKDCSVFVFKDKEAAFLDCLAPKVEAL